ncbi:BnaC04g55030D [Brassica napus]|uniref:BnaC04g55030D protein n=1 Tax=Brassica napus TaxID=3708 RepID=A0A078J0U1_BRANA|nr:BnaC04g55030D [Brassica napus]
MLRSYAARRPQASTETLISLYVLLLCSSLTFDRCRYVLKSVTEDIKEKIPYVAQIKLCNQGNVAGSFSPCRRHFMLQKLKNMKNYNNYLEEGRGEDEAVQLYFQRLTMTTMLRRVVKSRSQQTQGFQNITDKFMELSTKLLTARSAC